MGIIIAILLFSAIVIFHELGHFLLAKANKIRVDEFSLGLGPTIIGRKFGETKFSLKLLPYSTWFWRGYCALSWWHGLVTIPP